MTSGESHGQALISILEGIPAGLEITEDYIEQDLRRRQGGYGRSRRQQLEVDHAEIVGGVRHGKTMGGPIALLIRNRVWEDWQDVMQVGPYDGESKKVTRLRPGHADLAGTMKYGFDDVRPILERSSARETASRVAVGAVCRRLFEEFGGAVHSHTSSIGDIFAQVDGEPDWDAVEESPVRCADAAAGEKMVAAIDVAREAGDTLGGTFEMWATGVPIGLGSHVQWDRKLDGQLAQAIMSIQAVKGVEIGPGFAVAAGSGHDAHDVILPPQAVGRPALATRDQPRRWSRGRDDERRACRRPRCAEADIDALEAASLGRPAHRRGDPGALRALRRLHGAGRRRRSARRWSRSCWRARCSRSSAATRWTRRGATSTATRRRSARGAPIDRRGTGH